MSRLYARVFNRILDSSLAEDWRTRIVFEDFLKLADWNGTVDMTHEAIARRTNVPIDIIREAIAKLESPDPRSRNPANDGRRIVRLDDHRDWGWQIVNWQEYDVIRTAAELKEAQALRMAKYRAKKATPSPSDSPNPKQEPESELELESRPTCSLQVATCSLQNVTKDELPLDVPAQNSKKPNRPDSIEEVRTFFQANSGAKNQADMFWHHYESTGWCISSGKPLKKWTSAAHKWILKNQTPYGTNLTTGKPSPVEARNQAIGTPESRDAWLEQFNAKLRSQGVTGMGG